MILEVRTIGDVVAKLETVEAMPLEAKDSQKLLNQLHGDDSVSVDFEFRLVPHRSLELVEVRALLGQNHEVVLSTTLEDPQKGLA